MVHNVDDKIKKYIASGEMGTAASFLFLILYVTLTIGCVGFAMAAGVNVGTLTTDSSLTQVYSLLSAIIAFFSGVTGRDRILTTFVKWTIPIVENKNDNK